MKHIRALHKSAQRILDNLFPPSELVKEYEARAKLSRQLDDVKPPPMPSCEPPRKPRPRCNR